jgi:hypothetical protein
VDTDTQTDRHTGQRIRQWFSTLLAVYHPQCV